MRRRPVGCRTPTFATCQKLNSTPPPKGANVHLMRRRPVGWGGSSMVMLFLEALGLLLRSAPHVDFFINLSDADVALRTGLEIERFLRDHQGESFVSVKFPALDRMRYEANTLATLAPNLPAQSSRPIFPPDFPARFSTPISCAQCAFPIARRRTQTCDLTRGSSAVAKVSLTQVSPRPPRPPPHTHTHTRTLVRRPPFLLSCQPPPLFVVLCITAYPILAHYYINRICTRQ